MNFDWIIRNARTVGMASDQPPVDIGIRGETIAAVEAGLNEKELPDQERIIDAEGRLVSPGLIETHVHLDKSRILDRCTPSPNRGSDHMMRVSAVKPDFTVEDVYARARATLEACVLNGATHMRTHVEVDPNIGMRSFEALLQLREDMRWAIDLDLCVFAQEGMTNVPEADANVEEGLKRGVPVIGGAPGYDPDHPGHITRVFELAREYGADVDLHLDVGPTTNDMDIHLVCDLTEQYGMGGRVAIGHGTKYSCLPPDRMADLARRLADVGITVTVLPATDLFVMGRHLDHNIIRGVTDANVLIGHGVNCCLSTNNVLNPFTPFGDGSLIRIANLYANVVQRGMNEELKQCFDMMTSHPARLIGLDHHTIAAGNPADLVLWNAGDPAEAVATIALPLLGFKRGRRIFSRELPALHAPA